MTPVEVLVAYLLLALTWLVMRDMSDARRVRRRSSGARTPRSLRVVRSAPLAQKP